MKRDVWQAQAENKHVFMSLSFFCFFLWNINTEIYFQNIYTPIISTAECYQTQYICGENLCKLAGK